MMTVGSGRNLRYCAAGHNGLWAELIISGYDLVRMYRLKAVAAYVGRKVCPGSRP